MQFSFNSLKYEDVKAQIVKFLTENSQYSGVFDFKAPNISMIIDTMTYVTMLMSYQLSNISNNLFLDTTNFRKNAVSISKTMGYRPRRRFSSKIKGTATYDGIMPPNSFFKIKPFSPFISNKGNIFFNEYPIEIKSNEVGVPQPVDFILKEGRFKEFIYPGNGQDYQSFVIPSSKIEEEGIKLFTFIPSIDELIEWKEITNPFLLQERKVFFVEEDILNEGCPKIVFGNYLLVDVPRKDEIVKVVYIESLGELANGEYIVKIPPLYETYFDLGPEITFDDISKNLVGFINQTNLSFGGKERESLDLIKINAPQNFASRGRAITKNDFMFWLNQRKSDILVGSVIGGDELFPKDQDKLGNIYFSGVPIFNDKIDFIENKKIYLDELTEGKILYDAKQVGIISTKFHFSKPSYIYLELDLNIEIPVTISSYEEEIFRKNIKENIENYIKENFYKFGPIFRKSKINSLILQEKNILSSDINVTYNGIIDKDSFYEFTTSENFINLPVKIKEKDNFGNPILYESFIRTNYEFMKIKNIEKQDLIPLDERSIYCEIFHPIFQREFYNHDINEGTEELPKIRVSNIIFNGQNTFFEVYASENYETRIPQNILRPKTNPDFEFVKVDFDPNKLEYKLDIKDNSGNFLNIGTIYQNTNDYFKGRLYNLQQILNPLSVFKTGDYFILGKDLIINEIQYFKNDIIFYNQELSGDFKWNKSTILGNVSAKNKDNIISNFINHGQIFYINSEGGNFLGSLDFNVFPGDYLCFNKELEEFPRWNKINFVTKELDGSKTLPKKTTENLIKLLENGSLTLETGETFSENDLIMFNSIFKLQGNLSGWKKIINLSDPMDEIPKISAEFSNNLDCFELTNSDIGFVAAVSAVGSFEGVETNKIIWPEILYQEDRYANIGDLLIFIGFDSEGNKNWLIYSDRFSFVFLFDSSGSESLPIDLNFGDTFNVSVSGSFQNYFNRRILTNEKVVFLGNKWGIFSELFNNISLNPATENLNTRFFNIGNVLNIIEDGNFESSDLIEPGETFVDGDLIIFNGTKWIKLNEYSIRYNNSFELTGKEILNGLGLNSNLKIDFNSETFRYRFIFEDIFNNSIIGKYYYESEFSNIDVGKIKFERFIKGKYNSLDETINFHIKNIFNYYGETLGDESLTRYHDIIKLKPKYKYSKEGKILNDIETDFDGTFNQFIVIKKNFTINKI